MLYDIIETTAGKHDVVAQLMSWDWAALLCAALTARFGDEGRMFAIEQHEERGKPMKDDPAILDELAELAARLRQGLREQAHLIPETPVGQQYMAWVVNLNELENALRDRARHIELIRSREDAL